MQPTEVSTRTVGARAIFINCCNGCIGTRTSVASKAKVVVRTKIEAVDVLPSVSERQDKVKEKEKIY